MSHANHPQGTQDPATAGDCTQGRGTKERARTSGRSLGRSASFWTLVLLVGAAAWSFVRGGMPVRIEGAESVSPSAPSTAGTLHVPAEYGTIQSAIDAAARGATVVVAPGVYAERLTLGPNAPSLKASGGAHSTFIVGDARDSALVTLNGCGEGISIEGFDFAGCDGSDGPALVARDSSVRIVDCTLERNRAGGASVRGGAMAFERCRFLDNEASFAGGGASFDGGSHRLTECVFERNEAGTFGGAVYNRDATLTFTNTTFDGNATRTGAYGGAIYSEGGDVSATGCSIARNRALDDGGAAFIAGGSARFERCTFTANCAAGAWTIASQGGRAEVVDSVICGSDPMHYGEGVALTGSRYDDACFADCNRNGLDDLAEIAQGRARDDDGNMVPDDCDLIADAEAALAGTTMARAY